MPLYALYVPGPDEIWPITDFESALQAMADHNRAITETDLSARTGIPFEQLASHVIAWPYSNKAHAQALSNGEWDYYTPASEAEYLEQQPTEQRCDKTVDMFNEANT